MIQALLFGGLISAAILGFLFGRSYERIASSKKCIIKIRYNHKDSIKKLEEYGFSHMTTNIGDGKQTWLKKNCDEKLNIETKAFLYENGKIDLYFDLIDHISLSQLAKYICFEGIRFDSLTSMGFEYSYGTACWWKQTQYYHASVRVTNEISIKQVRIEYYNANLDILKPLIV